MIAAKLAPDREAAFARHARELGRTKSDVLRDLVEDCLERNSLDAKIARDAARLARLDRDEDYTESDMDD
jgi:hypothetical protein